MDGYLCILQRVAYLGLVLQKAFWHLSPSSYPPHGKQTRFKTHVKLTLTWRFLLRVFAARYIFDDKKRNKKDFWLDFWKKWHLLSNVSWPNCMSCETTKLDISVIVGMKLAFFVEEYCPRFNAHFILEHNLKLYIVEPI